jgi:hypothetical protein
MARHETPVPSSPALLGAIVYDCFSLEARNREKGAQGARPSLSLHLSPPRSPRNFPWGPARERAAGIGRDVFAPARRGTIG